MVLKACSNFVPRVHHLFRDYHNPLEIPCVVEIAKRHGKSPGQILLRHGVQRGIVLIPKSVTSQRIRENIDVSAVVTS